jgi:hypothetical protein
MTNKKKVSSAVLDTSQVIDKIVYLQSPVERSGVKYQGNYLASNGQIRNQILHEPYRYLFSSASVAGYTTTFPSNFFITKIFIACGANAGCLDKRVYITKGGSSTFILSFYTTNALTNVDFNPPCLAGTSYTIDMASYPTAGAIYIIIFGYIEE